jgi:hypothetical protein
MVAEPPLLNRLKLLLGSCVGLPQPDRDKLLDDLAPTIAARGAAVHFFGEFEDPVPHPVGGRSSAAAAVYSVEGAESAVRAMRNLYSALAEHPKPIIATLAEAQDRAFRELAEAQQ